MNYGLSRWCAWFEIGGIVWEESNKCEKRRGIIIFSYEAGFFASVWACVWSTLGLFRIIYLLNFFIRLFFFLLFVYYEKEDSGCCMASFLLSPFFFRCLYWIFSFVFAGTWSSKIQPESKTAWNWLADDRRPIHLIPTIWNVEVPSRRMMTPERGRAH